MATDEYPIKDIPNDSYYKDIYREKYFKYKYYKRKHIVYRALGYKCKACNETDPEKLEIHHNDNETWNGIGGRDRILKAVERVKDGDTDELELLCGKCHELRERGRTIERIRELRDTPEAER